MTWINDRGILTGDDLLMTEREIADHERRVNEFRRQHRGVNLEAPPGPQHRPWQQELAALLRTFGCDVCGSRRNLALYTTGGKRMRMKMPAATIRSDIKSGTRLVRCPDHPPARP